MDKTTREKMVERFKEVAEELHVPYHEVEYVEESMNESDCISAVIEPEQLGEKKGRVRVLVDSETTMEFEEDCRSVLKHYA